MKDVKWVVASATAAALGSSAAALAADPTKADFQACNREAKAAVTAHSNPGPHPSNYRSSYLTRSPYHEITVPASGPASR